MPEGYYPFTVRVLGPNGAARADAVVAMVKSPVVRPETARLTDDLGQCRMNLVAGEYTFEAHGDEGRLHARESVTIPGPATLSLRLQPR